MQLKTNKAGYDGRAALRKGRIISILVVLIVFFFIIWQGEDLATAPKNRTLIVYCFAGMQEVMENDIFPAFKQYWSDENDEEVEIIATFAGSGAIVDKIISRFPAEVAILSSPIDAIRLSEQMRVPAGSWEELPNGGVFGYARMVMIVRESNPLGIADFSDLKNPEVKTILPDPICSGAGQWALLALYCSGLDEQGDTLAALGQVEEIFKNVSWQPASAQEAVRQFNEGNGDVLIAYESNLLGNKIRNQIPGELVYPSCSIISEHIVLPIPKNITAKQRDLVDSFIRFLWSMESQQILAAYNFISVDSMSNAQPESDLFRETYTLSSLGGPKQVKSSIVDKLTKALINPILD